MFLGDAFLAGLMAPGMLWPPHTSTIGAGRFCADASMNMQKERPRWKKEYGPRTVETSRQNFDCQRQLRVQD